MSSIPKFPYQKTLVVENNMDLRSGKFSSYNKEDMQEACELLGGGVGYVLGTLFAGNATGFTVDLSPRWITETYGISENSYRNGLDDLRKYGYVIDRVGTSHKIDFYTKTVAPRKGLKLLSKTRSGDDDKKLKDEYIDLIESELDYDDYEPEMKGLYQRGKMKDGPTERKWEF